MGWLQRIGFLLWIVCLIKADNKPYCTPLKPQKSVIYKPTIPSQFSIHMEMIDVIKKSVTEMTEYYDGLGHRGTVYISENAGKSKRYYRYDQQLFLEVSEDIDFCIAIPISEGDHMMDFQQKNGSSKMMSPSAVLRFSAPGQVENYIGPAVIRGINTDHWHSCLIMQDPRREFAVDWYFSSATEWDTSSEADQAPVRTYVKGIQYSSPTVFHKVEMYIEYHHYRTVLPKDLTVFDTPRGLVCKNKQYPKSPPLMPHVMSFRLEHVDTQFEIVTYSDEVYDFENRLTKHVYKSPGFFSYSLNPLTVINDFNTGVSYNMDMTLGNCTIRPISQLPTDVKKVDSRHVRMTNPEEFFQLKNHFYQGVRKTRDIECNVWIGEKMDKSNKTFKVEWYFAKPTVIQSEITTGNTLLHYAEYRETEILPSFYSNLFDFTEDAPDILQFDVSRCYIDKGREKFKLYFDSKYQIHITSSLKKFKIDLIMSIAVALSISPLRIQNVWVTPTTDSVIVSFEILDIAPTIGDVENPINEKSLATAASEMHQMLKEKTLDVFIQNYNEMITVNPGELIMDIKTHNVSVTYSGGSMFALALAMTVLGIILSAFITFKVKAP